MEAMMTTTTARPLSVIAAEIRKDWSKLGKGIYFGAKPYLDAMATMNSIDEPYFADSGKSIVIYFLANANTWRGETARRIKAELKALAR
jgi:hypothetical protein